jgi:hypothetical protein
MKWMRLQIPDRLHQRFKEWAVMSGQKQNDIIYYLFDNIPKPIQVKQNQRLLEYINEPGNRKKLTDDQIRTYELIGLGLIKPTADEAKAITKMIGE